MVRPHRSFAEVLPLRRDHTLFGLVSLCFPNDSYQFPSLLIFTKNLKKYSNIKRVYVRTHYTNLDDPYIYFFQNFEDTLLHERIKNSGVMRLIEHNQEMINASDFCIFYYNENYKPPTRKQSCQAQSTYKPRNGIIPILKFNR